MTEENDRIQLNVAFEIRKVSKVARNEWYYITDIEIRNSEQ